MYRDVCHLCHGQRGRRESPEVKWESGQKWPNGLVGLPVYEAGAHSLGFEVWVLGAQLVEGDFGLAFDAAVGLGEPAWGLGGALAGDVDEAEGVCGRCRGQGGEGFCRGNSVVFGDFNVVAGNVLADAQKAPVERIVRYMDKGVVSHTLPGLCFG